ncbi:MAG: hypothetical protein AB8B57_04665 [Congregibacter sp.]
MRPKISCIGALAATLLLTACSTTGGSSASSADGLSEQELVAQTDVDADPRVCKRVIPTGTRIAKRACMKQSQWDTIRNNAQTATEDSQRRAVQQNNPIGN